MPKLNLSKQNWQEDALGSHGPACLTIRAWLEPVGGMQRFQPAGFPEIGHVIFDAPRANGCAEKVCIVDSAASMANHLESVCLTGLDASLHPELRGLPYVRCVTDKDESPSQRDPLNTLVCTTLTEGHRLASDYFLEGLVDPQWKDDKWTGKRLRDQLHEEFGLRESKRDKAYFVWPDVWWKIYHTVWKYDPNSLVHGVMFPKEQIKISRLLTAHMEALGATRVGRSGVKFDRLGKTTSGQPIFAVDEVTAGSIVATFIVDLALLRSYGRSDKGVSDAGKRLLLDLAVWKIQRLLQLPFRFRTGCHLACRGIAWCDETDEPQVPAKPSLRPEDISVNMVNSIAACQFGDPLKVYYPASDLFKETSQKDGGDERTADSDGSENGESGES